MYADTNECRGIEFKTLNSSKYFLQEKGIYSDAPRLFDNLMMATHFSLCYARRTIGHFGGVKSHASPY